MNVIVYIGAERRKPSPLPTPDPLAEQDAAFARVWLQLQMQRLEQETKVVNVEVQ